MFTNKELKRLKELYPKAKHFVYMTLPKNKEASFIVENRAPYKRSLEKQIQHLIKEHDYSLDDIEINSYDLRTIA